MRSYLMVLPSPSRMKTRINNGKTQKQKSVRNLPCSLLSILGRNNLARQPHPTQNYYKQNKRAASCEQAKEGSVMAGLKPPWLLCSTGFCPRIPS